jgi:hypothetical protein
MPHLDVLAAFEAVRIGDEGFDHETAAGREMGGDPLEAQALPGRVVQHEEGVVDDEDQGEAAVDLDVGAVADRDRDAFAAGFGAELRHHRPAGVDPGDRNTEAGEWQCNATGADRQLERRARARELGEARGRGVGVGRVRRQLVVDVGHAVAVHRRVVTFAAAHGSIASDAPAGGGRFARTALLWSPALRWLLLHPKGGVW